MMCSLTQKSMTAKPILFIPCVNLVVYVLFHTVGLDIVRVGKRADINSLAEGAGREAAEYIQH